MSERTKWSIVFVVCLSVVILIAHLIALGRPAETISLSTEISYEAEQKTVPETVLPDIELKYEEEIVYLSKTVWGEARGCSKTEQAAVMWCILNRVDSPLKYMPDTIIGVITQKNQFAGYNESFPVTDEIKALVIDVLTLWELEKSGETVDRVLPKEYLYFTGDGTKNTFYTEHNSGEVWNCEM